MICIDLRAPIFKWLLKREFYTCEEATGPCFAQSSKHEADVSACHWHWAPAKSQVMHIALWQRLSRVVTDKSDVSQISGDFDLSESSPMIPVAEPRRPACTGSGRFCSVAAAFRLPSRQCHRIRRADEPGRSHGHISTGPRARPGPAAALWSARRFSACQWQALTF